MRYLVATALILALLPGQGACLGHSHQASNLSEPDHHAARPHVHLHGHGHYGDFHHHKAPAVPKEPAQIPADEHDRDAVYVSAADALAVIRVAQYRPTFDPSLDKAGCLTVVQWTSNGRPTGRGMWLGPPGDLPASNLSLRNCVLRC